MLELERFVRVRTGHYRPRRVRVNGLEEILRQLTEQGVGAELVAQIETLMSSPSPALGTFRIGPHSVEPVGGSLEQPDDALAQVARLEPMVKELQWRNQALERRIVELERAIRGGAPMPSAAPFERPARAAGRAADPFGSRAERARQPTSAVDGFGQPGSASDGRAELEAEAARPEAAPTTPGAEDGPTPAEVMGASPENASPKSAELEDEEDQDLEPPRDPLLTLPEVEDYLDGLRGLVGDEIGLSADEGRPNLGDGWFMSPLVSPSGEVIGALVADLQATVRQGGGLIMLPESELDEMKAAGAASQDVLDAMGELFSVQSRYFNDIEGNPRVEVGAFGAVNLEEHPWLTNPAGRSDFVDSFGGRTVVLSK